jgi:hypothetical protein
VEERPFNVERAALFSVEEQPFNVEERPFRAASAARKKKGFSPG